MIPTFNCAHLLRTTLESVLEQDPGTEKMQIEVVDDCSTHDDPEKVVRKIGGDRVVFSRHPKNLGLVGNFNSCIQKARGELIHILHGDDFVLPGYYEAINSAAEKYPDIALYYSTVRWVDEAGSTIRDQEFPSAYRHPSNDIKPFAFGVLFQFPGVTLRRIKIAESGYFDRRLGHCADWEMWVRTTAHGGALAIPNTLACYRDFGNNDTAKQVISGENLRDWLRCIHLCKATTLTFPFEPAKLHFLKQCLYQRKEQLKAGRADAADCAIAVFKSDCPPLKQLWLRFWYPIVEQSKKALARNPRIFELATQLARRLKI